MKKYYTLSDGGCVALGNADFTTKIFNKFGDCRNTILIFDDYKEFSDWILKKYNKEVIYSGFSDELCVEGRFYLFNYDCLTSDEKLLKQNIKAKLNGKYSVYVRCESFEYPIIAIVKMD